MKNLKLKLTFLSLCAFATAAHAQQVKGNSVLYTSSQGNMRIEMCSESMFRVTKVPAQQMPDNEKWMVVNYNFPQVDFSVDGKQIKTSKLQVSIQEAPWRIQVADASGKVLYEELTSGCKDSIYMVSNWKILLVVTNNLRVLHHSCHVLPTVCTSVRIVGVHGIMRVRPTIRMWSILSTDCARKRFRST